jgi:putative pyruvate formate lyase activating enzyme
VAAPLVKAGRTAHHGGGPMLPFGSRNDRALPVAVARFISERPEPGYLRLLESGELERRVVRALEELRECAVCPRDCRVDRLSALPSETDSHRPIQALRGEGQAAVRTVPSHVSKGTSCFTGRYARVASAFPHFGEEDCLRGWNGSGTIFFSFCNLRCVFCQNWDTSQVGEGVEARPEELAALMLDLQGRGCHNINVVTPEHVVPQLLEALQLAAEGGLRLPIVYNTSGYDSMRSLELLDGAVDIYMPDFKYWDPLLARRYVKAQDYPEVARRTIREMHRQVGPLCFDEHGLAIRGVLVRHLVMPGCTDDAARIMRFLARDISTDTYVNVMDQYAPAGATPEGRYPELCRRPHEGEIDAVVERGRAEGLWRFDHRWEVRSRIVDQGNLF